MSKKIHLSKSQFIRGSQCFKALWLDKNRKDLKVDPDIGLKKTFAEGNRVGDLAKGLFPDGREVEFNYKDFDGMLSITSGYMEESDIGTIYEASFKYDNIFIMADILVKGEGNIIDIYEVKSSTGVKDVLLKDLALQVYVLEGLGYKVGKASLIHIDTSYERNGEVDVKKLLRVVDVTRQVLARQDELKDELDVIRKGIDTKTMPLVDIGEHCSTPYGCDYNPFCREHIPDVSVFNLYRLWSSKKFELYYKGIIKYEDIPESFNLSEIQVMQLGAELQGKEFVNKTGIKEFLTEFKYPLYFLDFETFQSPIPPFDGMSPYNQIPFQYSLHVVRSEEDMVNDNVEHYEFLAEPGTDPREDMAKRLVEDIKDDGTVIAYNMGFEKGVISRLASHFTQYSNELLKINDNMIDLIVPFRGRNYYTKAMNGSFSIKSVLPALVPELSYDAMDIGDGQTASAVYASLHLENDDAVKEKHLGDLLKYCHLDTLAMVELYRKLREVVK